ncbi:cation transporter [Pseudomonas berkeleyensis]|uniref:Heavy-metal-associated domain-containing protein n=1 Tax=Pseudomonas berkeleyensis TaxID=2726956 RepID=A0A7G5DL55_9PSED|nr:cation transporter [Pseudomonas berkeleyensis]QMV62480.1 heavy-metal-associated domain-containing protein [Pseudomonas berkeleyensis]WSO37925.1 cation transporter [Pseudomonas berkeleyensis]
MQQFKVSGMSCGHCVRAITQAIQMLDQAAKVEVDLAAGLVRVESSLNAEQVQTAIREEGYQAELP